MGFGPGLRREDTDVPARSKRYGEAPKGATALIIRNITVCGTRTSVRLEPEMWDALADIGGREGRSLHELATLVASNKAPESSLATALRVFVLAYFREAASQEGHERAGHGDGILSAARLLRGVARQDVARQDKATVLNGSADPAYLRY